MKLASCLTILLMSIGCSLIGIAKVLQAPTALFSSKDAREKVRVTTGQMKVGGTIGVMTVRTRRNRKVGLLCAVQAILV